MGISPCLFSQSLLYFSGCWQLLYCHSILLSCWQSGQKESSPSHCGPGFSAPSLGHTPPQDCRASCLVLWQLPAQQSTQWGFFLVSSTCSCLDMSVWCRGVPTHFTSTWQQTLQHNNQKTVCQGHVTSHPNPSSP